MRLRISRAALLVKVSASIDSLLQNLGYAIGKHACFSATGASHDYHGPFGAEYSLLLRFIECVEV